MRVEGEKKEKTNLLFRPFPITDVLAWHCQTGRWHIMPVEERYLLAEQAGRKRKTEGEGENKGEAVEKQELKRE